MRLHRIAESTAESPQIRMMHQVAQLHATPQLQRLQVDVERERLLRRIIERHSARIAMQLLYVLHKHVAVAKALCHIRLQAQRILVEGYQLLVLQQFERRRTNVGHITSYEQWRTHDAPHAKVHLLLRRGEAAPYLQHVHIVIVPVASKGREVEALTYDALHRVPVVLNISAHAPRASDVFCPCARISPATDVDRHIVAPCAMDSIHDVGVLRLLIQTQFAATAEVYLDEVESPLLEVEIQVYLLMPIEARAYATLVVIAHRATRIRASIRVDARLQT